MIEETSELSNYGSWRQGAVRKLSTGRSPLFTLKQRTDTNLFFLHQKSANRKPAIPSRLEHCKTQNGQSFVRKASEVSGKVGSAKRLDLSRDNARNYRIKRSADVSNKPAPVEETRVLKPRFASGVNRLRQSEAKAPLFSGMSPVVVQKHTAPFQTSYKPSLAKTDNYFTNTQRSFKEKEKENNFSRGNQTLHANLNVNLNSNKNHAAAKTNLNNNYFELQSRAASRNLNFQELIFRQPKETQLPKEVSNTPQICNAKNAEELLSRSKSSEAVAGRAAATKSPTYCLEKQIGKGSYAVVYAGLDFVDNKRFAIKVYNKEKMSTKTRRSIIENEIRVMRTLNHEFVMKFHKVVETASEIHLVLELLHGVSLSSWVRGFPDAAVPEEEARPVFRKLLYGLAYLHSKNVFHRDLKLENVLLVADDVPKIIDFGFATAADPAKRLELYCGTPNYMSPEIVRKVPYCGGPSDAWAFGVLFFRALTGVFPFASKRTEDLNRRIAALDYFVPRGVSQEARRVIEALLIAEPADRATFQQLKTFRFFVM